MEQISRRTNYHLHRYQKREIDVDDMRDDDEMAAKTVGATSAELKAVCSKMAENGEQSLILTVNMAEKYCMYVGSKAGERFLSERLNLLEEFFKLCEEMYYPGTLSQTGSEHGTKVMGSGNVASEIFYYDRDDKHDTLNQGIEPQSIEKNHDRTNVDVAVTNKSQRLSQHKDGNVKFQCRYCDNKYVWKKSLLYHLDTIHPDKEQSSGCISINDKVQVAKLSKSKNDSNECNSNQLQLIDDDVSDRINNELSMNQPTQTENVGSMKNSKQESEHSASSQGTVFMLKKSVQVQQSLSENYKQIVGEEEVLENEFSQHQQTTLEQNNINEKSKSEMQTEENEVEMAEVLLNLDQMAETGPDQLQESGFVLEEKQYYECEVCETKFTLKSNLQQHLKTMHKNVDEQNEINNTQNNDIEKNKSLNDRLDETGTLISEKKSKKFKPEIVTCQGKIVIYTCRVCKARIWWKKSFKRHFTSLHPSHDWSVESQLLESELARVKELNANSEDSEDLSDLEMSVESEFDDGNENVKMKDKTLDEQKENNDSKNNEGLDDSFEKTVPSAVDFPTKQQLKQSTSHKLEIVTCQGKNIFYTCRVCKAKTKWKKSLKRHFTTLHQSHDWQLESLLLELELERVKDLNAKSEDHSVLDFPTKQQFEHSGSLKLKIVSCQGKNVQFTCRVCKVRTRWKKSFKRHFKILHWDHDWSVESELLESELERVKELGAKCEDTEKSSLMQNINTEKNERFDDRSEETRPFMLDFPTERNIQHDSSLKLEIVKCHGKNVLFTCRVCKERIRRKKDFEHHFTTFHKDQDWSAESQLLESELESVKESEDTVNSSELDMSVQSELDFSNEIVKTMDKNVDNSYELTQNINTENNECLDDGSKETVPLLLDSPVERKSEYDGSPKLEIVSCHGKNVVFTCRVCKATTSWKKSYKRHFTTLHKSHDWSVESRLLESELERVKKLNDLLQPDMSVESELTANNENVNSKGYDNASDIVYVCKICQAQYTWIKSLKRHFITSHIDHNWSVKCFESVHIRKKELEATSKVDENAADSSNNSLPWKGHMENKKKRKLFVCSVCKLRFKWKKTMKRHFVTKHQKLDWSRESQLLEKKLGSNKNEIKHFVCDICNKKFMWKRNLIYHLHVEHNNSDTFCDQLPDIDCERKQKSKPPRTVQNSHELNETDHSSGLTAESSDVKNLVCRLCNTKFKYRKTLKHHLLNMHKNDNPEKIISLHFDMLHSKHEESHEKGLFVCELCDAKFEWKTLFESHMNETHDAKGKWICKFPDCSQRFYSLLSLRKHQTIHKAVLGKCKVCKREFNNKAVFDKHQRLCSKKKESGMSNGQQIARLKESMNAIKVYPCNICRKHCYSEIALQKHRTIHTSSADILYNCHHCGKIFRKPHYLSRHLLSAHKENRVVCKICKSLFHSKENLVEHMKTHNLDDPKTCSECGKQFETKEECIAHKNEHPEETFVCEFCGKVCKKEYILNIHRRIHSGEKPYQCSTCGMSFIDKRKLRTHAIKHQATKQYHCEICGHSTGYLSALKSHIKRHENIAFPCEFCDRSFLSQDGQRNHVLLDHIDLIDLSNYKYKFYKCEVCGKVFGQKCTYQRHMAVHEVDKPYRCDICGKSFVNMLCLKNHRYSHDPSKRFNCDICGSQLSSKDKLRKHFKSQKHLENCKRMGISVSESKSYVSTNRQAGSDEPQQSQNEANGTSEMNTIQVMYEQNDDAAVDLSTSGIQTECIVISLPDNVAFTSECDADVAYNITTGSAVQSIINL